MNTSCIITCLIMDLNIVGLNQTKLSPSPYEVHKYKFDLILWSSLSLYQRTEFNQLPDNKILD